MHPNLNGFDQKMDTPPRRLSNKFQTFDLRRRSNETEQVKEKITKAGMDISKLTVIGGDTTMDSFARVDSSGITKSRFTEGVSLTEISSMQQNIETLNQDAEQREPTRKANDVKVDVEMEVDETT